MKGLTEKEQRIFNYGIIVGQLETIARFNDKTDHVYNFELSTIPKLNTISESIKYKVGYISENYEIEKINSQDPFKFFFKLLHDKWFYAYQDKNEYHLSDIGKDFSLFFDDWKIIWVEEFVNFLLRTIDPIQIYKIEYYNFKSYYASDYDEFIFECENEIYYLKLLVHD